VVVRGAWEAAEVDFGDLDDDAAGAVPAVVGQAAGATELEDVGIFVGVRDGRVGAVVDGFDGAGWPPECGLDTGVGALVGLAGVVEEAGGGLRGDAGAAREVGACPSSGVEFRAYGTGCSGLSGVVVHPSVGLPVERFPVKIIAGERKIAREFVEGKTGLPPTSCAPAIGGG
jgi:hypothetical protein